MGTRGNKHRKTYRLAQEKQRAGVVQIEKICHWIFKWFNRLRKNVSLRFKADGFEWGNKFDLEVKANEPHGAIAFLI